MHCGSPDAYESRTGLEQLMMHDHHGYKHADYRSDEDISTDGVIVSSDE